MSIRRQSGFSILGVIIAAGAMGTISVYLMDQILGANRAQLSLEKRMEVSIMRQRLMAEIDCANTLAGVNPATDCTPTNFLTLRNRANNVIGTTPGLGIFLNSRTFEGRWNIRATCDVSTPNRSLDVRVALAGASPGTFGKDPLHDVEYNWTYPKGMIFGATGSTLCSTQLGGAAAGPPSAWKSGDMVAGGGCQSNYIWGDDGNDESVTLYSGTVLCDPGTMAVSGSVDCGAGGTMRLQHSMVTPAGDGWTGACCPDGGFTGVGAIKVLCQ